MVERVEIILERKVQNNAYTLQGDTKGQKRKPMTFSAMGWLAYRDFSCFLQPCVACRAGSDTEAKGR